MRYVGLGLQHRYDTVYSIIVSAQRATYAWNILASLMTSRPLYLVGLYLLHLLYVWRAFCVSGPLLCTGDIVIKVGKTPCSCRIYF